MFLGEDVWGQESIVDWFQSQWDRYDCQHEPLLAAGTDHVPANFSGCAFSFWQDKVRPCGAEHHWEPVMGMHQL